MKVDGYDELTYNLSKSIQKICTKVSKIQILRCLIFLYYYFHNNIYLMRVSAHMHLVAKPKFGQQERTKFTNILLEIIFFQQMKFILFINFIRY